MATLNDACRRRATEVKTGTLPPWGSSHSCQGFCRWLYSLRRWGNPEHQNRRRALMQGRHSRNRKARRPCGQVAVVAEAALLVLEAVIGARWTASSEIHEQVCCCRCHKDPGSGRVVDVVAPAAAPKVTDRDAEAPELVVVLERPDQRRRRRRGSAPKRGVSDPQRIDITFPD